MKTVYIPKGETVTYEELTTGKLVVQGRLVVQGTLNAKSISGCGVISVGELRADTIVADDVSAETIICEKLLAKRVSAVELFASDSALVSGYLSCTHVETGKLTVALNEIETVEAREIVNLRPKKRGLLRTLLLSTLRSCWLALTYAPPAEDADYEPAEDTREKVADTVREIMEEDDQELQRLVTTYRFLRGSGYSLKIVPEAESAGRKAA